MARAQLTPRSTTSPTATPSRGPSVSRSSGRPPDIGRTTEKLEAPGSTPGAFCRLLDTADGVYFAIAGRDNYGILIEGATLSDLSADDFIFS
jgi:hypothetical protein